MIFADFMYSLKNVLISPEVIGTAIVVTLFLQLFFYIINYHKKTRPIFAIKIKKTPTNEVKPN